MIGDGSIISLHETKPLGRGEGGAVFVSAEMVPFVHKALNFGYDIPNGAAYVPSYFFSSIV